MSARCIFLGCCPSMLSVGFLIIWSFTVQLFLCEFPKGHGIMSCGSTKGIDPCF